MPSATLSDGASLHYEEHGEGKPLVWLCGTGHTAAVWEAFQLPAFVERYRCIVVDWRGCGGSSPAPEDYSIVAMAADVRDLLAHLGLGSAHLVGFSMGSAVLQELALAAPDAVRSAVMWGTWSCSPLEHHIRRHFAARALALEQAPTDVFRAASFWAWAPSFVEDEGDRMAEIEVVIGRISTVPAKVWADQFRADIGHDTLSRLPQIRCPTLVLYGDEDLITMPRHNRRVAEAIPGAELRSVAGAGHMAFAERPDECNAAIREFLDGVS